ncbi:CAMK family protein kinase [Trichomonas vaginalis G3]|uniref:non-specific serine/threonine protein kinase n=1 Tax=Trichomonas vaginalis (strain ATCC PRA-98 / G3) TaxID=412133 RepID=A2DY61_TRIV3|nr:STKc Nek domain-containing protein [Trichomonas vaginalis G3]EAY14670.1 CAMK family protein kinase [Trichomonas vaginalis G3]KAI5505423.1 STKc Nek domain-containing protein [Trichomonas vaginalis G3]|eukprot:XP_001326893.1 CAMK family protein kinase [Trichomonas vaginalis G3]
MSLSDYQVIQTIGTGSYGKVVLAKEKKSGTKYAIKKVKLSGMTVEQRQKALEEVNLLLKLNHPNIVRCYKSFIKKCTLHIVMDYVDGGNLDNVIEKTHEYMSEMDVLSFFIQIVIALSYIHKKNIIHRDIKPENVFLMKNGIAKLGDFGISKTLESSIGLATTVIGTPYYLAPEVWSGEQYNTKADMWSLGCILYEMCALEKPFTGENQKELFDKILAGHHKEIPSMYSNDLRHLVDGLLSMDPSFRPTSAQILQLPFIRDVMKKMIENNNSTLKNSPIPSPGTKKEPKNIPSPKEQESDSSYFDDDDEEDENGDSEVKNDEFTVEEEDSTDDFGDFTMLEGATMVLESTLCVDTPSRKIEKLKTELKKSLGEQKFKEVYDDMNDPFDIDASNRLRTFEKTDPKAAQMVRDLIDLEESSTI